MYNARKSLGVPASLANQRRYDSEDVILTLKEDFYAKCYICGSKTSKDLRVEHFIPHENDPFLIFSWDNLFWSCDYCNGIKSNTYNKNGTEIINPTIQKPEEKIQHTISSFPLPEISFLPLDEENVTYNTIELLEKIFIIGGTNTAAQIEKREQLLRDLKAEMYRFISDIYQLFYLDVDAVNQRIRIIDRLKDDLKPSSNFIEFKRVEINSNKATKEFILKELEINEI